MTPSLSSDIPKTYAIEIPSVGGEASASADLALGMAGALAKRMGLPAGFLTLVLADEKAGG